MAGAVGVKAGQALVGREGTWVWCGCLLALARVAAKCALGTALFSLVRGSLVLCRSVFSSGWVFCVCVCPRLHYRLLTLCPAAY